MKKLFIPFIIFIGISINVSAQEKSRREIKGDKYAFTYSFDKAIDYYTRTKQLSIEGQRHLAESYHNINLNVKSEEAYQKLVSNSVGVIPEDYYNYAMVLKTNGKYDQARQWMDKFAAATPGDLRAKDYLAKKAGLAGLLNDDGKFKVQHLNINTNADDFGTNYYQDKIVFSSSRSRKTMIVHNYNWTGKPFYNMYMAEVDGDQLKSPKRFGKKLNNILHDGPASFSNNGTYVAFTKNHHNDMSRDLVVELQIFFSTFVEGKWLKAEPFVLNNSEYSVGQPFLSADGNTMYFTSDMPGGYGGADIYRIKKAGDGAWGKAENLGDKINTEGDEMYPFIEEGSGIMYFASNGRYGLGGLDIFICPLNGSGFGQAVNAGSPVNTANDDFAMIINNKTNTGYFSSNRSDGSGGDDIYSFVVTKEAEILAPELAFTVIVPENIPTGRRVRETFPVRNYVFFDLGSTEISDRYVLLKKEEVQGFKEDQLEVYIPKNLSGRSNRQMTVYYNILNILGDRMVKNPTATIKLLGASEKGPEDGLLMAASVKAYLVNIFGIHASRITLEGRDKPKLPTVQEGQVGNAELYLQGDRRVSIESSSPLLLMEFQSGPDAPLKPLEIVITEEAPIDSYISFELGEGKEDITSWALEVKDDKGTVQYIGPYTVDQISIPGKSILGDKTEGDYTVTMIGQTKSGVTVKNDTTIHLKLWTPPADAEEMRFTVLYGFDETKAIPMYERYITDVITPKIPKGAKVVIHGYTDILGDEIYNKKLSLDRANDVKRIMETALANAGRNDVRFEVYGFGEDPKLTLFNNKYPEERFYNRSVMIDIIPR